jgi:ferritin
MYEEDDDFEFEDHLEEHSKKIQEKLKEIAKKEFVEGCYMAYNMLVSQGPKALESGDMSAICKAIDRMMSLFINQEEYERCQFLAKYVKENIPGYQIIPDPMVNLELED